jgi:hypothetical protein
MGRRWFKAGLIALLVGNASVYLWRGTPSEALDSLAWLVLLLSFEAETGRDGLPIGRRAALFVRSCRLVAAAALVAAAIGYFRDEEWLDVANLGLWIAVVALLEAQVRYPGLAAQRRAAFIGLAVALYSALSMVTLAWAWRGEWFDAWDAALWLIAFATIEMNLFQKFRREPAPARAG